MPWHQHLISSCTLSSDWFQPVEVPCKWSHVLRSECIFISLEYKKHEIQIIRMWFSIICASQLSNYTVKFARFIGFYGEKGGIYSLFDCCLFFFPGKRHGDVSAQWPTAEQQWASHSLHHWYQHSQVSALLSFCKIVFHCALTSFEHWVFSFM